MRKHVQTYQNEVKRYAQNAEQPITCLKGPITKDVHTRVHQLRSKFFPTREPEAVQDGICYLKVIIDSYHCNARPATAKVKKQLSRLHMNMREAARGDVSKLCQHTRELLNKLYAARETTTVLSPNLLGALASAPNEEFHLWLQRPMIIKATNDSESYPLTL